MTIFIDKKYLMLVSPRLKNFKQKKSDLWNFRCPYCNDSKRNKQKARGYIYKKKNDLYFKCFNCEEGHTFFNFLKHLDTSLSREYSLERFVDGQTTNHNYTKPKFIFTKPVFSKKESIDLESINELSDVHYAKQYILNRKIPEQYFSELYFCDNFKQFIEQNFNEFESKEQLPEDSRIIIPFYNEKGKIICIQGRALNNSKLRYITIKKSDELKIFGLNRIKSNKTIYVVEGPLDSLFLDNCLAVADSNLTIIENVLEKYLIKRENVVLIWDNQPRNERIVKQIEKGIEKNFKVCLLPKEIKGKDLNEIIINGTSKNELENMINMFTYDNIRAKIEFVNWKKV